MARGTRRRRARAASRLSSSSPRRDMTAATRPVVLLALVAILGGCESSGSKLKPAAFGPGLKVVGKDVAPGLYRSDGSPDCGYERLRGLTDKPENVIIEDDVTGPAIVTIHKTDKAFDSDFCGNWKPISTAPISDVRIHDGTHVIG